MFPLQEGSRSAQAPETPAQSGSYSPHQALLLLLEGGLCLKGENQKLVLWLYHQEWNRSLRSLLGQWRHQDINSAIGARQKETHGVRSDSRPAAQWKYERKGTAPYAQNLGIAPLFYLPLSGLCQMSLFEEISSITSKETSAGIWCSGRHQQLSDCCQRRILFYFLSCEVTGKKNPNPHLNATQNISLDKAPFFFSSAPIIWSSFHVSLQLISSFHISAEYPLSPLPVALILSLLLLIFFTEYWKGYEMQTKAHTDAQTTHCNVDITYKQLVRWICLNFHSSHSRNTPHFKQSSLNPTCFLKTRAWFVLFFKPTTE